MLLGALLLGWGLAAVTEPDSVLAVALLSSFLGGAILLNVLRNELPQEKDSSFGGFLIGALKGAILLAVAAVAGHG